MAVSTLREKLYPETVHMSPPRSDGTTPCCGRTPFELPRTDRMTTAPSLVTCTPPSTLREKLEALATEWCNGSHEYRNCAVHSAKAQAMARALLIMLDEVPVDEGLAPWIPKQLLTALDRADARSDADYLRELNGE